jgi:hypothetical protein
VRNELKSEMDQERRTKLRYPLRMNVRYQTLGMGGSVGGVGQTLNVSSGGAFLNCGSDIREGTRIRVVMEWPSLLDGATPLQLVTIGIAVRRQGAGLGIAFEGYQFRTAGRRANIATISDARVSPSYGSAEAGRLRERRAEPFRQGP